MSLGTAVTEIAENTIVLYMHIRANDETLVCTLVAHQPEIAEGERHWDAKGNFKEQLVVQDKAGKRPRQLRNASCTVFSLETVLPRISH